MGQWSHPAMTLIIEIESRGPRYVAGLTHLRVIRELLALEGLTVAQPWEVVRLLPRQPDWSGPHRIALARGGRLLPGITPPALLRKIEDALRRTLPDQQIVVRPAVDPNLIIDARTRMPAPPGRLKPGELHTLLGTP